VLVPSMPIQLAAVSHGSWGKAVAKEFGARGVGIDIDPQRIDESNANAKKAGVTGQVTFREEDLFEANISEANVVTLFLWPSVNLKLRPKLLKELKPGTRVVSHSHDMDDWKPDKSEIVDSARLYLWVIPPRPASGKKAQSNPMRPASSRRDYRPARSCGVSVSAVPPRRRMRSETAGWPRRGATRVRQPACPY
jgi:hypothetical protein